MLQLSSSYPSMTNSRFTFLLRLGSSIALWTILSLAVILKMPVFYLVLLCGLGLIAQWEFFQILGASGIKTFPVTAMVISGGFLIGSFFYYQAYGVSKGGDFDAAMVLFFVVAIFVRQMFSPIRKQESLQAIVFTLFGILYIPWLFHFISRIIFLVPPTADGTLTGPFYAFFAIVVTKFSDMGGYVFGSLFGRRPFVSHISPKKTWEGLFGAIVSAVVAAGVTYAFLHHQLLLFRKTDILCLGFLLGGMAVVGDLAESVIKRSIQAKDSSHLLPGIGGILDLIDSLLFTVPVLFFYLRWVIHPL